MITISKGRIEARNKCARKYFYSYLYKKGWNTPGTGVDLQIGIWTHTGLEALLKGEGDILVAMEAMEREKPEDPALLEHWQLARGMVLGWFHAKWKDFIGRFEVLSVERQVLLPLAVELQLLGRIDVVVRERATGFIFVVNWKTTKNIRDWTDQWRFDIQMWTESLVAEEQLGEAISGCIVIGLYKGQFLKGHWTSPLIWGFKGGKAPDGKSKLKEKSVPGWEKVPMWEDQFEGRLEPGVDPLMAWITVLPASTLEELFLESLPIFRNEEVVEEWLEGIVRAEEDARNIMETGSERDQLSFFRQSFSKWNCADCTFWPVCGRNTTIEDLVESGRLVPRSSPITELEKALQE